jgi:hypothetical protein
MGVEFSFSPLCDKVVFNVCEEAFMKWWQYALLVIYLAGNFYAYLKLRDKPAPFSSKYVSGWMRPWIAILWMWGPTLWFMPGLCWLSVSGFHASTVLLLSFCIPLAYFAVFFLFLKLIPFSSSKDKLFSITIIVVLALFIYLGFYKSWSKFEFWRLALYLFSISLLPLLSIGLMIVAPLFIIPLEPGTPGLTRESIRMVIGHFTSYPKPAWCVEDGEVQTRVKGNAFLGTGPSWLMTEPENLVVLKKGVNFTRLAGPGVVLPDTGESPFKVIDLRNQIRSTQVTATTKDGVEVRFPVSSLFRVNPDNRSVELKEPWPYVEDNVWDVVFAEPVEPTSQTPLEANQAYSWQDLPLRIAVQKVKQAIGFYTYAQLYRDGTDPELVSIHKQVEEAFELDPESDLGRPLTRSSIGKLVQRAVRKELEPEGFEIHGGGIGAEIRPVDDQVTEQQVEEWKARFIKQMDDWQAEVEQLRIESQGRVRASRTNMLVDLVQEITERASDRRLTSEAMAYWVIDSLMQITADPGVQRMLPDSSMRTIEDLSAWGEPSRRREENNQ